MDSIAKQIATLLGISENYGFLVIGILIGFVVARIARVSKHPVQELHGQLPTKTVATGFSQPSGFSSNATVKHSSIDLDPNVMAKIRACLDNGNKIEAIKTLREATGLGLAESKTIIESLDKVL